MTRLEIKALREKQNEIVAESRTFLDAIKDDSPDELRKEQESKFDKAMEERDKIEDQIVRETRLLDAEERAAAANDQGGVPGSESRSQSGSEGSDEGDENNFEWDANIAFRRVLQYGMEMLPPEARALVQCADSVLPPELRAQSVGTDTAGGFTVPEGFSPELVKTMLAWGPMLDPGVTRELMTSTGNQVPWPTIDDTANQGALLAENTAEGEQDLTFGQKLLNAYKISSDIIRVSFELVQDSGFNMDGIINDAFGERLGRRANQFLTTGTGSSQPNGIVTASALGKTAASATAITFNEVFDLFHSIDPAYRASPSVRFMFEDSTLLALRKLTDGQGNYLWQEANGRTGEPASISGAPYIINQAMAAIATGNRTIVFGDFNKYVVRKAGGMQMLRLVERYAEFWQVGFIAMMRIDGELLDTGAVKHLIQA